MAVEPFGQDVSRQNQFLLRNRYDTAGNTLFLLPIPRPFDKGLLQQIAVARKMSFFAEKQLKAVDNDRKRGELQPVEIVDAFVPGVPVISKVVWKL